MDPKTKLVFQPPIFRGYISGREGNETNKLPVNGSVNSKQPNFLTIS